MSINFGSGVRMTVNSKIAVQLDMILADTINQRDTIRIYFPSVTNFVYNQTSSNVSTFVINGTSTTYDAANRMIEIRQRTLPQTINFANRAITLQLSTFTAPPSIKPFSITFQVLRSSFLMAQGTASTSAVVNSYTGNVTGTDLGVNRITSYDIAIDIKDNHTGLMMI